MNQSLAKLRDKFNNTLLHKAAQYGRQQFAELLLFFGCNANDRTHYKATPLHFAALYNMLDVAKCLLLQEPTIINLVDKGGFTALDYAFKRNHQEMVNFLLQQEVIDVTI